MATSNSSLLAIERLQGPPNYHQWRVSAEAVLRRERLWGIVSGRNKRADIDATDTDKIADWDDDDDKAVGTLILSMNPTEQTKFTGKNTSLDLWDAVEAAYAKKSVQTRIF